jgi:HEAT repeat protein
LAQHNQTVAHLKKQTQERANANPPTVAPAVRPAETLEQLLSAIKNPQSNYSQKSNALNAVKRMTPDDKTRKDVLDAVEPLLKDSNSSLQSTAIAVFGVWGTEDRAEVLFEMADGFSQSHRWAAMRALGSIGGKKSAEVVVKRLTDSNDMLTAADALKKMGSAAEEPVLKLINHPEQPVRYQVYNILGKVGGPKSASPLKASSQSDESGFNRAAAKIALQELERR